MSERGSFITQYVYCGKCWRALLAALPSPTKWLAARPIVGYNNNEEIEILAGKIGGTSTEDILYELEAYLAGIASKLCCPLEVVAVTDDSRYIVYTVKPVSPTGLAEPAQAVIRKLEITNGGNNITRTIDSIQD